MRTPKELREFHCDDYFAAGWAERGHWEESSQLMVIVPFGEHEVREDFLVIGRPGVDGLAFGYRRGERGVWVYYPIGRRYVRVANSTADLVDGWCSGRITV